MECFSCEYEGSRRGLGSHYGSKPDHRPKLTDKQHEIITGLLMGDGHINRSSKNPCLRAEMINKDYLDYIDSKFPHIGLEVSLSRTASEQSKNHIDSGFNTSATAEEYSDCYWWETMTHQGFEEYASWYDSGKKEFPSNLRLTPTILKHWYVFDGSVSGGSIRIYVTNERDNKDKIESYFNQIGIDTTQWSEVNRGSRSHTSINFSVSDSKKLFEYMGEPVPGFEHKWI